MLGAMREIESLNLGWARKERMHYKEDNSAQLRRNDYTLSLFQNSPFPFRMEGLEKAITYAPLSLRSQYPYLITAPQP